MNHIRDKSHFYAAFLFVLWPFLALISAFLNNRKSWAKNIFWAFCAFYGFVFAIGAESQTSDIVRYAARIEYLNSIEMGVADAVKYFMESGEIDILNTIISFLVSRFTGSQAVLTLVYGTIFGYFLSRNLWFVLDRLEGRLKPITLILIICFFLVNPIWNLNGFRMWTAAHIFIYGALSYLFDGNKKGLWWCVASIFVHFSFMVPVFALFGYLFMGNRLLLYFGFFLITSFVSEIDIQSFNRVVENYAPEILQERTETYRSEERVESHGEGGPSGKNWYVVWYGTGLRWAVISFLIVMFLSGKEYIRQHHSLLNLYSFTLLFHGVANLMSSIPSGGRFLTVVNLSAIAIITFYIQNRPEEKVMKRCILLAMPALMLYIVVSFRIAFYSLSAATILGNPVIALFTIGENISLNDVLKLIF